MQIDKLKKWDKIFVVSPSSKIDKSQLKQLLKWITVLKKMWFEVELSKWMLSDDKYLTSAWEPEFRAEQINEAFVDKDIKMIWMSPWWTTANQVLDFLDYDLIKRNNKFITWFSDNTIILNAIYKRTWIITYHGTDLKSWDYDYYLSSEETLNSFKKVFVEDKLDINDTKVEILKSWKFEWNLIWWHLQSFCRLIWTEYIPDLQWWILMLESFTQWLSQVIPFLTHLKQAWVFDKISGIITWYNYYFEQNDVLDLSWNRIFFEDILIDVLGDDYKFPILKTRLFGHRCPVMFLPIWEKIKLEKGRLGFI